LNERLVILGTALVFFTSLSISYLTDISKYWGYMGFSYDPDLMRLSISLVFLSALSFILRAKGDTISFIHLFVYLTYICPSLVYFSFGGAPILFIVILCSGFIIIILFGKLRLQRPKFASISERGFLFLMIFISALTVILIIGFGGLRYFNLDPLRVYEFRRVAASSIPSIFGYIISPVSKVVLPIGILLGLLYRSKIGVAAFIFLTVMMFGLTHHKSILVAPFVVLAVYWSLTRFGITNSLSFLFISLSAIILAEIAYFDILGNSGTRWFSTFIVRRVFFLPPLADGYYITFFSSNPFMFWSTSKITFGLVASDYSVPAPFLIGEYFFGNTDTSANTGFVGSGFSNAGVIGVYIYAALIGLVLSILNAHGRHVGHPVVICASLIVVTSAITSSDFLTVFLTHGLLFLLICLAFMPREKRSL